ncbi:hypothetical protein EFA69_11065 [Rufibacter immobilis]|uniref:Uncharacterized protein n=1 Tax=Rufibacter immobilis TaxID=1348778 RepID=A0A3M9MWZ8_9BACT|nr:hypothetical protein EFA69_11065 [Rufibacter immobilis]
MRAVQPVDLSKEAAEGLPQIKLNPKVYNANLPVKVSRFLPQGLSRLGIAAQKGRLGALFPKTSPKQKPLK